MTRKNTSSKTDGAFRPFLLKPAGKDYLWGGHRLKDDFSKEIDMEPLAETWECSTHPDGPSIVASGAHKGMLLTEVLKEHPEYMGTHPKTDGGLPILIKFIDAKQDLSVQVHPDDEYARKYEHGSLGKTEMWYIVDCEEGAGLYYGFSKEISKEEFQNRIENQTLLEVLNWIEVKKGDVFFIEPGTIHAIGKGILIAEIQQNSNVTYRVYDYGRRDANGKERELHVEKALQVTNLKPVLQKKSFAPYLVSCEYFKVDKVALDGRLKKRIIGEVDASSFVSLLILDGSGEVQAKGEVVKIKKGDSIFITAGSGEYKLEGCLEALFTTL